ncbi:hypothetical protein L596_009731 [Steinernema carpocapsae]|uniref:Thioredoxin domain-containing protein n=1 Tax=Steinernema carpocapsae TaxID=34508 RepID=A0A4U5PG70_STECR|nr:hypothetical protein L596_009731 [Steinernema carpocapsae]
MRRLSSMLSVALLSLLSLVPYCLADAVVLTDANFDQLVPSKQLSFVVFGAEWCPWSRKIQPIFAEASEKLKTTFPNVLLGTVDCERNPDLTRKFQISKYPTLKLFRAGEMVKKEYRGQRSVEAFEKYLTEEMKSAVTMINSQDEFNNRQNKEKNAFVAYFPQAAGAEYDVYQRVTSALKSYGCEFYLGIGPQVAPNGPSMVFVPSNNDGPLAFSGSYQDYNFVKEWVTDKCIPFVREITFENAEELTEEGKPFLILFRMPEDKASEKVFTEQVMREVSDQRNFINCLIADGQKFAHPLHHLGKTVKDLPLVAIDSFRHMYLLPTEKFGQNGAIRQFVQDLHSGKLHDEFHNGPKPTEAIPQVHGKADNTQPPPSVFKQLKPSDNRYSILGRDEL